MDLPDLIEIRNGARVKPTFSDAEMERRLAAIRKAMARRSLGAAVFTSHPCVNDYADFLYRSFGRPCAAVVTHDRLLTVSADIDRGQPWRRTHGQRTSSTPTGGA